MTKIAVDEETLLQIITVVKTLKNQIELLEILLEKLRRGD